MPRLQWLMQKTASWVLSLDLNLPSLSQGSVQQPAKHQAGALLASAWISRPPSQGASRGTTACPEVPLPQPGHWPPLVAPLLTSTSPRVVSATSFILSSWLSWILYQLH